MGTYGTLTQRIWGRILDTVVVPVLPAKTANLIQCHRQGMWNDYFKEAEASIEWQWDTIIWPLIKEFDFSTVLELSPGRGRNTQKLCTVAKRIIAVDYNEYALEQTRARLGSSHEGCQITYHRNGGADLSMVSDASVTAVYCWDSAIHFDRSVVTRYIAEFARVLKPGGSGFLHHSDLGNCANKNIKLNPNWRSNVNKELVAAACRKNGLTVKVQQLVPWPPIIDCATVFCRD
jgi:ubiquinone/menaquinone biosynthesis C-methylase UbiE